MAKSKIEYEWNEDCVGRSILIIKRKKGRLTWADVIEDMTGAQRFEGYHFVMPLHITGELPKDLYDDSDIWVLYPTSEFFGKDDADRFIAEKPSLQSDSNNKRMGICPVCGGEVKHVGYNDGFCGVCGKALDWSK